MRRIRLAAAVAAVALVVTPMPRASAFTVSTFTVVVPLGLGAPLDWACPATTAKCVVPGAVMTTKPGPKGTPVLNTTSGGNHVAWVTGPAACAEAVANPGKPGKSTLAVGPCGFAATGGIWGYCNLAAGMFMGVIGGPNPIGVVGKFDMAGPPGVPTPVAVTGEAFKGAAPGWLVGSGTVTVIPAVVPGPPPAVLNNCATKTALTLTLSVELTVVLKNLP